MSACGRDPAESRMARCDWLQLGPLAICGRYASRNTTSTSRDAIRPVVVRWKCALAKERTKEKKKQDRTYALGGPVSPVRSPLWLTDESARGLGWHLASGLRTED